MAREHTHSIIRRKNQNTKRAQKILLYVEGRNTEPSYFDLLKRSNCTRIPVTVRGHGIGACVDFVKEVLGKYNTLPAKEKAKYKQRWMVFDNDGHEDFAEGIRLARKNGFKVAFSSMCIEYWFMLHFYDHNGSAIPLKGDSHSKAQIDEINKFIKKYNKSSNTNVRLYDEGSKKVEEELFDLMLAIDEITHHHRIEDAYQRAKVIHQIKKRNGDEFSESVTTMYELLEELGTVQKDKDGNFILNKKL